MVRPLEVPDRLEERVREKEREERERGERLEGGDKREEEIHYNIFTLP